MQEEVKEEAGIEKLVAALVRIELVKCFAIIVHIYNLTAEASPAASQAI